MFSFQVFDPEDVAKERVVRRDNSMTGSNVEIVLLEYAATAQ
jgi:hypothetical protein